MAYDVTCAGCGDPFEAKSPRAKWCSERCKKRKQRKPDPEQPAAEDPEPADTGLVASVRRDLEEADALDSFAGQLALQLARRMCKPDESGISSLSKELRTVMAAALEGVVPEAADEELDPVAAAEDELARKRERLSG